MNGKRRKYRRNRGNGVIFITMIMVVFLAVMGVQIVQLKQKVSTYENQLEVLEEQYEQETQRELDLAAYEAYTKTEAYIEEIAKSKLGLAYANEIIFKERN